MMHMEAKIIWTCGLLIIYLIGCFGRKVSDEYVTFLDKVIVWKGSCAMLPCEYKAKETIDQFIWYYNATYNKDKYDGKIVYDSKSNTEVDHSFVGRVQHVGKQTGDCTIVIRNIQKQHEGIYQLRLLSTVNFKWMSKQNVIITVPENGPTLEIHSPPEIKESETVTLTCSIRYYCPFNNITLNWIEEVNGTSTTNVIKDTTDIRTTSRLVFSPSWKDDKKNITCVLDGDGGEADNKTVQLNVMHAPKNVQVLPNNATIKIKKKESLTLTCSVESSNPPISEITWFKDNPRQRQNPKRGSADQIEVTSSGKYFCKAKNIIGELTSNSVEVSVLYPPDKPEIKRNTEIIKEGTDITLECSTKANPPVLRYIWYKDMEICYNHTDAWFKISKIKEDDSGSYTCSARNELGETKSNNLELNVMYAPRYPKIVLQLDSRTFGEEDKIIFVEGDTVTFQCEVNSSNPVVAEIIWYKDGKKIEKISKPLQAKDAGKYMCEAKNSIGGSRSPDVNVDILYSPKDVQIKVPIKAFKENEIVRLRCLSKTSKPEISGYEWYKDGDLLKTSTSDIMELRLEWTHTGWYSCKALNDIGSGTSEEKRINVQYAPQNVTLSVIPGDHVTEFTDVKLTCTGKGNPARYHYQFYQNDKALSEGNHYYDLNDVQIQHTGEYYCSAENDVGNRRSNVVSLHVSYSSTTIGKFAIIGVSSLIFLLILIFLIVRFRICIRNALRRKAVDGKSDPSFFVMKKSNNESADNMGRQIPSMHSSTDQLNYSTVNVPAPAKRRINPPSPMEDNDITTVYSVIRKVPNTAEYENIASSKRDHEDSQDDIHYSVIAHLNKKAADRERGPDVEYAKLRHS